MKTCTRCGKRKSKSKFYQRKASKDGLCPVCKECDKQRAKEWRESNKERKRETSKRWRKANEAREEQRKKEWREKNKERWKAANKKWYKENRDESLQRSKGWYQKNKNKCRERVRNYQLKSQYGITAKEYDEILTSQGHVCACCRSPSTGRRRLAVDHDHSTSEVRGLLCDNCNTGIGRLGDTESGVQDALIYLRRKRQTRILKDINKKLNTKK